MKPSASVTGRLRRQFDLTVQVAVAAHGYVVWHGSLPVAVFRYRGMSFQCFQIRGGWRLVEDSGRLPARAWDFDTANEALKHAAKRK